MPHILYTPDVQVAEVLRRPLARVKPTISTVAADAFALLGADLTGATVEAGTGGLGTTVYTNDVGEVTGDLLVTGISVSTGSSPRPWGRACAASASAAVCASVPLELRR